MRKSNYTTVTRKLFQIEREFELLYTENLALQEKLERANRQQASSARHNHDEVDGAGTGNAGGGGTHAHSVKFQTQHSSSSSKVHRQC